MERKRRLLLIGTLALALGALSSFHIYKRLQAGLSPSRNEVDVVIAADDIQVGAKIGDHDLKVVKYPAQDLPSNVFHTSTPVLGRGAILPIRRGEFVVADQLAGENGGAGLPALIASGMRAVAVRVNDVTSVNGFAVPGARVDVLATGNVTGSEEPSTITLLQNVAVLASGQKIERSATGEPQNATVVTLLAPLEDAEKLALATEEAHIQTSSSQPARHEERETRNCRKDNAVWWRTVKTPRSISADKTCSDGAPRPGWGYRGFPGNPERNCSLQAVSTW